MTAAVSGDAGAAKAGGGDGSMPITAADVATQTGGRLIGDPSVVVRGIAPLDRAGPEELSFLAHARYASWFATSRAGVVLISPLLEAAKGLTPTRIVVDKPVEALLPLLARFHRSEPRASGVHPTAVIAPSARVGAGVTIDPYAVVGENVSVGDGTWIGAGVSVGVGSVIGRNVRVFPNAVVYPYTELGDRVVLHAGAQVGREGFGFVPRPDGVVRIPHIGRCVLEHDVEIGANSCVDRGSVDDTVIGAGTKIDNLVQIGHNVRIGRFCFVASQAGVAGSARIEDGVQVGGQAGIGGHLTVGAKATVAARAGVIGDMPGDQVWSGYPARAHKEQMRTYAAMTRLVRMIRPLERLLARDASSAANRDAAQ